MERYLVTGAAGFIAARVCELLLDAGAEVVGIDNLNDAYDPQLKRWRLQRLLSRERFAFTHLDIVDRPSLDAWFATADPATFSAVVHLAARAGVRPSVAIPSVYYETNVTGTLNLLEACRRLGIKKFVLASTSSLYGAANSVPFREDANTDRPLSPYAASKKAAETLAYTYHYLHGLDVTVPRYFTVYGPAARPDMSVFRFIRRIAESEPIQVYGDGQQQRDFTFVDDIAQGTVAAIRPAGYEVVNLGGDRPARLRHVIDTIAELLNQRPLIEYRPLHPADVPATWADISKARALLDWTPGISLDDGLRRSVEWYLENREEMREISLSDD